MKRLINRLSTIYTVTEGLTTKLEDVQAGLKLSFINDKSYTMQPQQHTLMIAIVMYMCRFNFGDELVAAEIQLARPEPADAGYINDFFRCPVYFDAEVDSVWLIAFGAVRV